MGKQLIHKTFISTRPKGQNKELKIRLENEGAKLLELPTIEIKAATLTFEQEDMLQHISQFSWIVFSSVFGVQFFFEKLYELNGSYYLPASIKIATIGSKTSSVLSKYGQESTLENPGETGTDLAHELINAINNEDFILFPEGDLSRRTITEIVSKKAECVNLVMYHNSIPNTFNSEILDLIINDQYDGIILSSPSGFNNLISIVKHKLNPQKLKLICIGTTTETEVLVNNIIPIARAETSNIEGIVHAILNLYHSRSKK